MNKYSIPAICVVVAAGIALGCRNSDGAEAQSSSPERMPAQVMGHFNGDSAYQFVADQVAFGPRVPGTDSHAACARYIENTLRRLNVDSLIVQRGSATAYTGDELPITNIIAGFNTDKKRRILLVAHYDTRPWADKEDDGDLREEPIPGANDGGSGVGVLLEIARNLAAKRPTVGVDLLFVDAEDYGKSDGFINNAETWCLGTQYWVDNMIPYNVLNKPVYGILLDMVGGRGARFHYEDFAARNARVPTVKVWSEAEALGYGDRFIRTIGGAAIDDHIFLTRAGIPTTNVIEINNEETSTFPPTWHTHDDNMDNIDPATLKAVGQTVLNVVYKEKAE